MPASADTSPPAVEIPRPTSLPVRLWRAGRLLLHLGWGLPTALLLPRLAPARRNRIVRAWSRGLLSLMHVRLRTCGELPPDLAQSRIVVANHLSWLDIFALNAIHATRFIAKSEIRAWPLLGWLAHQAGALFIQQASRRDALRIAGQVAAALQPDTWLGFFPEGGIGDGAVLQTFHTALFEPVAACQARLSAVAIRYFYPDGRPATAAYYYEVTLLASLLRLVSAPEIIVELEFTAPIETIGHTRRQLAHTAQQQIAAALGEQSV